MKGLSVAFTIVLFLLANAAAIYLKHAGARPADRDSTREPVPALLVSQTASSDIYQ